MYIIKYYTQANTIITLNQMSSDICRMHDIHKYIINRHNRLQSQAASHLSCPYHIHVLVMNKYILYTLIWAHVHVILLAIKAQTCK